MMNHYLTINRKDYPPKQARDLKFLRARNKIKNNQYKDPINESFKQYLCVDPCKKEYSEELDTYFDKAVDKYPGFKTLLKDEPIDKNVIRKNQIYEGRSVYQVIYCDIEKEIADKEFRRNNAIVLPNDSDIKLTTQKGGYRNPISINSRAYERVVVYIPPNSLDPDDKIRTILQVRTGDTEYMGVIGKLGERIAVEQLHGHVHLL